jgi:hypothetical protein
VQNSFLHLYNRKELKVNCQEKRCIRQLVLNAVKNVRFHSNPTQPDLFTAANAGQRNDPLDQETGTKPFAITVYIPV